MKYWLRWLKWLGLFGAFTGTAVAVWALIVFLAPDKPASEVSVPATVAPEVKRAPTARKVVKAPVKVYAGDTKAKLKLPADVIAAPQEDVIASTQVRGSERPQTITTTINTETGESRSFVKSDPYPWFALEPRGEARLSVGYRYDGSGLLKQVVRLSATQDLIRVKALTLGATGTVDSDGRVFAGVGVAYKW